MKPRRSSPSPDRMVVAVGSVIGLSILGDSLMYSILPLDAASLGIPLTLVGVLLSVNRFVRLFSNSWASLIFERLGPRPPFIIAAVLSLITTALYGVGWGFTVFLFARLSWGIAWSGLRQGGYQAVWGGDDAVKGRLIGILWGVVSLGSALSVLAGGYLRDVFGYRVGVWAMVYATALALPLALTIRWPQASFQPQIKSQGSRGGWRAAILTPPRRWLLIVGFLFNLFQGILVSTTALFLENRLILDEPFLKIGIGIGTVTGFLLAVRWASGIIFAPIIGSLSDRLGQPRTSVLLVVVLLAGTVGVVSSFGGYFSLLFLGVVLLVSSGMFVTLNAAASGLAKRSPRPHLYMGVFSTAIDSGSAIGPLLAYSLSNFVGFSSVYLITTVLLLLAVLRYWWVEKMDVGSGKSVEM